jgi:hypothetical protein
MTGIFKLFGAVAEWIADHFSYIVTVVITVVVVGLAANWWYGTEITRLEKQVQDYAEVVKKSNETLDRVKEESTEYRKRTEEEISTLNITLSHYEIEYDRLLEKEKKGPKTKTVVVEVQGPERIVEVPVYFNQNQEVVCNRFFDAFAETANEMIDKVNSQVKGKTP